MFSYVLLAYGYELSIFGVYTYGQPLVENRRYAGILNNKLGSRFHRWINHGDIIPRIPVFQFPSTAWYYHRIRYPDTEEYKSNNNQWQSDHYYYHSGFRFRINHEKKLERNCSLYPSASLRCSVNERNLIVNGRFSLVFCT